MYMRHNMFCTDEWNVSIGLGETGCLLVVLHDASVDRGLLKLPDINMSAVASVSSIKG